MTDSIHDRFGGLRRPALELLVISFAVLFQELVLIRWLPGQVRVLGYFPNLVLISAFLGLGLGSLRADKGSLAWLWPGGLLLLTCSAWAASHIAFTQEAASEHLWLLYYDLPEGSPVVEGIKLPILLAFVLTTITFLPLGQAIAIRLRTFRKESSSLWGYCWDLGGSFLGVVGFAIVSFSGSFPAVWFVIALVAGSVLFRSRKARVAYAVAALLIFGVVVQAERASYYSPYYALDTAPAPSYGGLALRANGALHQVMVPLGDGTKAVSAAHENLRSDYRIPYSKLEEPPRKVLILGAGTGNDVITALEEGAGGIDAVEIDPMIQALGESLHPDRPWDSQRVEVYITDARSFLDDNRGPYDLVVFGTLDSMTRLSALSNVRLDNFVYTKQCLERVREVLAPDGGVAMYFMVSKEYIHFRLFGLLAEVFGEIPQIEALQRPHLFSHVYLAGPAFRNPEQFSQQEMDSFFADVIPELDLPTDDWPYLYLESRGVSSFYLSLIAAFVLIGAIGVLLASPDLRLGLLRRGEWDPEMFLFGLAFLLMESRYVTQMSLVWGATWLTSAVVFGSILLTILVATVWMQLRPISWRLASMGLLASLMVTYFVPGDWLVGRHLILRLALSLLFVGAPIFFASACFALRFKVRRSVELAFGWNLIGAVAGGLLEFLSMAIGIRSLSLVAALAYLLAFWLRERGFGGLSTESSSVSSVPSGA